MKTHLKILFIVTLANYIAQIPYSIHLYHKWYGDNFFGSLLLLATFLLFGVSYVLLLKRIRGGYEGILAFLTLEFAFYFSNFINSILRGFPPFFQLRNPDPILFVVFLIGYINLAASGFYLFYLIRHQSYFVRGPKK